MKAMIATVCLLSVASVALASPPAIPATPAAIDSVLYARPFTLNEGYAFAWNKARPQLKSGTLLVLKVNPDLVHPRQVAEPVLYVGNQTAERINHGHESGGQVVAIVPGNVDLTKTPIWFGTPDLPERIDAAQIRAERRLAEKAGIKPISAEAAQAAVAKGGNRLRAADHAELLRGEISELILEYAPAERHLVDAYRTPVVQRAASKKDSSED